jgi:dihydroxyacetone kinase-like predicted kinase
MATIKTSVEVIQEVSSVTVSVLPNASNTAIQAETTPQIISEPSLWEVIISFISNLF